MVTHSLLLFFIRKHSSATHAFRTNSRERAKERVVKTARDWQVNLTSLTCGWLLFTKKNRHKPDFVHARQSGLLVSGSILKVPYFMQELTPDMQKGRKDCSSMTRIRVENHTATLNSLTSILMCFTLHTKWWRVEHYWNLEALKYVTRASLIDFKCPSQLANLRVNVIGWEKGEWAVLCPLGKVYEKPADVKWSCDQFPTPFLRRDFFLVMSMESVTKLSLKRSLSETFHEASMILYMSKSIFPRQVNWQWKQTIVSAA